MKIPIDKIVVSKDNPRQSFDEEGLRRLGESILAHGQLQAIIVRSKGSQYELVVGERRLRACALVGINEIEAEVRDVDDATCMELRLIENTQREDLTYAEKGDAVLSLWGNYDKYKTIKDIAEAINIPYPTVIEWTDRSRKLSSEVRELSSKHSEITERHIHDVLKYPHSTQLKLIKAMVDHKIASHKSRGFINLYDKNPNANLEELANKAKGIETVTILKKELPEEVLEKIEEKKQLAKTQRIYKKPSKPITKEEVRKKTDFKFVKATVSHGTAGLLPPLKTEVKPTILPSPITPDYALCRCAVCPLFATHCKGRCWA